MPNSLPRSTTRTLGSANHRKLQVIGQANSVTAADDTLTLERASIYLQTAEICLRRLQRAPPASTGDAGEEKEGAIQSPKSPSPRFRHSRRAGADAHAHTRRLSAATDAG